MVSHFCHTSISTVPHALLPKRKVENDKPDIQSTDDLRRLLSSTVKSYDSAEVALLHIMQEHDFSLSLLHQMHQILSEDHMDVSFANVKYMDMAPFMGLNPNRNMHDISTFDLYRSRIPTSLFESIVDDMDILLPQYGPIVEHQTEEATSQFLAPIFNRLIAVFGCAFRNLPESMLQGHITNRGRVEYFFKSFGAIAFLVIEVTLNIGSGQERLDAIAQVIAECNACHWNNTRRGLHVPVYGILCDGTLFQFFLFDGNIQPYSFSHGILHEDTPAVQRGFQLNDPETPRPFIRALCWICELIFDLMLASYISSLNAYHNHSVSMAKKEGKPRKSTGEWERALALAGDAVENFRNTEIKCQNQLYNNANVLVQDAMALLKSSIDLAPNIDKTTIIKSGWDKEEVEVI
ncbi:hypothetical protein L208DRAFT_1337115 [Tricholoma matsutake]|nr:hypothetical protein L208DRAFT_1337115 [Tricholoma matsutake 945]